MLTTDHNYHRPILLKHTVPNSSPVTTVTLMSNTYLTLFEPSDRHHPRVFRLDPTELRYDADA